MEKFLCLPIEKQNTIIDAALMCFGTNGYKKTSVNDIAIAAGISKAMVFHYFGTKKAFYLYLFELAGQTFMNEIREKFDSSVTDFFDRVLLATKIKISVMKKHPALLLFLNSAYFENDDEVKADVSAIFANEEGENFRSKLVFDGLNTSKFKEGVDPKLVMKMLMWFAYGYLNTPQSKSGIDLDVLYKEFEECIYMLKNNFYKPEYL